MVRPPAVLGRVLEACSVVVEASHGDAELVEKLRAEAHIIKPQNGTSDAVKKLFEACTTVLNCDGALVQEKRDLDDPVDEIIDFVLQEMMDSPSITDTKLHARIDTVLASPAFNDLPETRMEDRDAHDHFKMPASHIPRMDVPSSIEQCGRKFADGRDGEKSNAHANHTAPGECSAHYLPKSQRHEESDPYLDDDDPGYRIRELYETELLEELKDKQIKEPPKAQTGDANGKEEKPADEAESTRVVKYTRSGDPFYPVEMNGTICDCFHLRVVYERDKTGFEESKEFAIRMNDVIAARYQVIEYLGSAAFSRAVQCLDLDTNRHVCMKIIKNDKDFFDQSLDEIKLLNYINVNDDVDKQCVLRLFDYFYHKEHLIIVTELLRDNLYEFSKYNRECESTPYFTLGRLQKIAWQVLTSLEYVHELRLIHCDLKPENILIKSYSKCEVKVIDFGSSCFVNDHLSSYVQSRSYRAPEVLLGLPYNQKIDVWSLGCIMAELWTGYVLFQNESVPTLLARVLGVIGDVPYDMMTRARFVPQYFTQDGQLYQEVDSPACPDRGRKLHLLVPKKTSLRQRMGTDDEHFLDFLTQTLKIDPAERCSSKEAKKHPWFKVRYPDGLQD